MAIKVYEDTKSESHYTVDERGTSRVRGFYVDGLDPAKPRYQREWDAITAVGEDGTRIPQYGEAHPGVLSLLRVTRIEVRCDNSSQAKVTAHYATPQWDKKEPSNTAPCQVSVGAAVASQKTNLDVFGKPMLVTYNGKTDTAEIDVQYPSLYLRLSRREPGDPSDKAATFVGCTNSQTFKNQKPDSWLCTRIEGRSEDGGGSFLVDYEFMYSFDGWHAVGYYKDPATGKVPADAIEGNGLAKFQMYFQLDFNALMLGV